MQKGKFSPTFSALIIALIFIGVSIFIKHKKDRDLIALNEAKSKLTDGSPAKKASLAELIKKNLSKQEEIAQNQAGSTNLLTQERTFTDAEINDMTEEQFVELIKDTERKMPKVSDLKKIPTGALHTTPTVVIQAGRDLGVIKEVLKVHESYERVATPFYKTCAKSEEGVTSVRALCLTNLIEIKKKNNESVNLNEYPSQLVQLSRLVIDN